MSEKRELAILSSKQYDSANTKETVVQTSTKKGNKEQDITFSHSTCRTEYAFTQQNENTNKCRYFRNLKDFASNGKFLTEQKQHIRNMSVEFKAGLEHLVKRRIVFREYTFNNGIFHVYITETALSQIAGNVKKFQQRIIVNLSVLKHYGVKHNESTSKSSTVLAQTKDISKEEKLKK